MLSDVPKMRLKLYTKLVTCFDDNMHKQTKVGKIEESCKEFLILGPAVSNSIATIFDKMRLSRLKFGLLMKKNLVLHSHAFGNLVWLG